MRKLFQEKKMADEASHVQRTMQSGWYVGIAAAPQIRANACPTVLPKQRFEGNALLHNIAVVKISNGEIAKPMHFDK